MMGMQVEPAQLFYEFRLDDHVPSDHLLRKDRSVPRSGERALRAQAILQHHRSALDRSGTDDADAEVTLANRASARLVQLLNTNPFTVETGLVPARR